MAAKRLASVWQASGRFSTKPGVNHDPRLTLRQRAGSGLVADLQQGAVLLDLESREFSDQVRQFRAAVGAGIEILSLIHI